MKKLTKYDKQMLQASKVYYAKRARAQKAYDAVMLPAEEAFREARRLIYEEQNKED